MASLVHEIENKSGKAFPHPPVLREQRRPKLRSKGGNQCDSYQRELSRASFWERLLRL